MIGVTADTAHKWIKAYENEPDDRSFRCLTCSAKKDYEDDGTLWVSSNLTHRTLFFDHADDDCEIVLQALRRDVSRSPDARCVACRAKRQEHGESLKCLYHPTRFTCLFCPGCGFSPSSAEEVAYILAQPRCNRGTCEGSLMEISPT